jgi:hypothetical protein
VPLCGDWFWICGLSLPLCGNWSFIFCPEADEVSRFNFKMHHRVGFGFVNAGEVLLSSVSLDLCCVIVRPCIGCVFRIVSDVNTLEVRLSCLWSGLGGLSSLYPVSQWFVGPVVPFLFSFYDCPLIIGFVDRFYRSCVGLCRRRRMSGIFLVRFVDGSACYLGVVGF